MGKISFPKFAQVFEGTFIDIFAPSIFDVPPPTLESPHPLGPLGHPMPPSNVLTVVDRAH